jgi:hypothetical protein
VEDLRTLRSAILSQAGCETISPISEMDAILAIHAYRFDVLWLCDQTDFKTADQVCRYFRAANPTGRIVVLDSMGRRIPCAKADAVIDADNPQALVNAACPEEGMTRAGVRVIAKSRKSA